MRVYSRLSYKDFCRASLLYKNIFSSEFTSNPAVNFLSKSTVKELLKTCNGFEVGYKELQMTCTLY